MSERRYGNKPSHPLPVWNGILEHRPNIGPAIWEFLWCIDKVTIEEDGIGWCLGKQPIKTERIAADLKESLAAARDNLTRLDYLGYITRIRTPYGHSIGVKNSRKFGIWKPKRELDKTPTLPGENGRKLQLSQNRVGENSHPELEKTPSPELEKTPVTKKTLQESTLQETQQLKETQQKNTHTTASPRPRGSASAVRERENWFVGFWNSYPQCGRVNQPRARAAFLLQIKTEADWDLAQDSMNAYKRSRRWYDGYVPYCATFLRNGYWKVRPPDVAEPPPYSERDLVRKPSDPIVEFLKDCMMKLNLPLTEIKAFLASEYGISWPLSRDLTQEQLDRLYADITTWAQKRRGFGKQTF